jgi:hypothetical protein
MKSLGIENAIPNLRERLASNPGVFQKAKSIQSLYQGQRGLMVVDVISSRMRNYEHRVSAMLRIYKEETPDLSLEHLATNPPPDLGLMKGEAETMMAVSQALLDYGKEAGISSEDEICFSWASKAEDAEVAERIDRIPGIGPALLQYLRLLSGVDTIKPDIWVRREMAKAGIAVDLLSDAGIVEVAREIAKELEVSLAVLDQLLWVYPDPNESLYNGYLT